MTSRELISELINVDEGGFEVLSFLDKDQMGINTHTYWQAEFATNFQITASTYALKKKERKKKELAYVHEQAGTYTLHILVKAITVNDSLYIGCR